MNEKEIKNKAYEKLLSKLKKYVFYEYLTGGKVVRVDRIESIIKELEENENE
jgi:hypothetical protein